MSLSIGNFRSSLVIESVRYFFECELFLAVCQEFISDLSGRSFWASGWTAKCPNCDLLIALPSHVALLQVLPVYVDIVSSIIRQEPLLTEFCLHLHCSHVLFVSVVEFMSVYLWWLSCKLLMIDRCLRKLPHLAHISHLHLRDLDVLLILSNDMW